MAVAPSDGGGGEVSSVVPLPEGGEEQQQQLFRAAFMSLGDAAAADASVAQHAEGGLPALQHSLLTQNLCFASKGQRASFISRALYSNVCMI